MATRPAGKPSDVPARATADSVDAPHLPLPHDARASELATPFAAAGSIPAARSLSEQRRHVARPDLARAAMEQLLSAWEPTDLTPADFDVLDGQYGLSPGTGRRLRLELWCETLENFCSDRIFTPAENLYLGRLADAFGLPAEETEPMRLEAAAAQFRAELVAVMADLRLSPEERLHLDNVATGLGLPLDEARKAIENTARNLLARTRARAGYGSVPSLAGTEWIRTTVAGLGLVLSEAEEQELAVAEAHWHQIDHEARQRTLEREAAKARSQESTATEKARLCHAIDEILATKQVSVLGTRATPLGTVTHYLCEPATLWGWRPHPTNRYESGSPMMEDSGQVFITSDAWLFEGSRVTRRVRLSDLLGAVTHPDGLVLHRRSDGDLRIGFDCAERTLLVSTVLRLLNGWDEVAHDERTLVDLGIAIRM
jgi:hypothetical protein